MTNCETGAAASAVSRKDGLTSVRYRNGLILKLRRSVEIEFEGTGTRVLQNEDLILGLQQAVTQVEGRFAEELKAGR